MNLEEKLKIPQNWNDLTIGQMIRLEEIILESDEYEPIDLIIAQLHILTGIDLYDPILYEMSDIELYNILDKLKWMSTTLPLNCPIYMEHNGIKYKKISFNEMIATEYQTLVYYLTHNYKLNAHYFIATCYRRYIIDEYQNEVKEKFEFDFEQRSESLKDCSMQFYPVQEFIDFRNLVYQVYDLTNKIEDDEESKEIINAEPVENYREKVNRLDQEERDKIHQQFNWEKLYMDLTKGDINASYKMLDLPILYIFNMITMLKNT